MKLKPRVLFLDMFFQFFTMICLINSIFQNAERSTPVLLFMVPFFDAIHIYVLVMIIPVCQAEAGIYIT